MEVFRRFGNRVGIVLGSDKVVFFYLGGWELGYSSFNLVWGGFFL